MHIRTVASLTIEDMFVEQYRKLNKKMYRSAIKYRISVDTLTFRSMLRLYILSQLYMPVF